MTTSLVFGSHLLSPALITLRGRGFSFNEKVAAATAKVKSAFGNERKLYNTQCLKSAPKKVNRFSKNHTGAKTHFLSRNSLDFDI